MKKDTKINVIILPQLRCVGYWGAFHSTTLSGKYSAAWQGETVY